MKNESIEPKILAPVRMLQVLQEYSDQNHLLTYADIIEHMDKDYNLIVERKTIQRNLINLQNAGFEIITTRRGCYLAEREFENSELRLLIDSVLFSKHIPAKYAEDLIEKLQKLGNKYFRKTLKAVYNVNQTYHTKSPELFYTIDKIGSAINDNKQISFIYNEYEIDKMLHPIVEKKVIVSPFQLIASNNHYYLVGNYQGTDDIVNFRVEKITAIDVLESQREQIGEDYKKRFNLKEYIDSHPYMYCGQAESIKLKINTNVVGEVIDAFGDNFIVEKIDGKEAVISLKANIQGMFDWAMRMGNYVEVISPQGLRDKIRESVTIMERKYSQNEDDIFNKELAKGKGGEVSFVNIDLSKKYAELSQNNFNSITLKNNNLKDIGFLANYKQLKSLTVVKNPIKDFSALTQLKEIKELSLTETELEGITFLEELPELSHLTLINNLILDYSPLYSLRNLQYLCIDYKTATGLALDRIRKNNRHVHIKIENPYIIDRFVKYEYNQSLFIKKVNDNLYSELRVDDNKKIYSIEDVEILEELTTDENYDIYLQIVNGYGYKQVDVKEMGKRYIISQEPFVINKRVIEILEKQIEIGTTSVLQIQKTLKVPYGFAVNIIDWMIENKYIEQSTEHGKYNVVLTKKEFIEKYGLK